MHAPEKKNKYSGATFPKVKENADDVVINQSANLVSFSLVEAEIRGYIGHRVQPTGTAAIACDTVTGQRRILLAR